MHWNPVCMLIFGKHGHVYSAYLCTFLAGAFSGKELYTLHSTHNNVHYNLYRKWYYRDLLCSPFSENSRGELARAKDVNMGLRNIILSNYIISMCIT